MKKKLVKQAIFGMLVFLLAAVVVFPAAAAKPAPVQVVLIEGDPEGDTITTQANQSWLTYDDGTCSGKCRINTHIPTNASSTFDQVPYPPVSTLWVQVNGSGGYSVCFNTTSVEFPQVWQYVDGHWVLVSTTVVNNMICVRGYGEGVFGLFGIKPPPSSKPVCIECEFNEG